MSNQATAPRPARPRPKRGEGQWALGYREPLNANEQSKKDDDPLNVRARIEAIYSKRGFALDRPRRPARPVPLVGPLHPARRGLRRRQDRDARAGTSSTTEYFMMRVRSDGALLGADAAARAGQRRHRLRPGHRRHHRPAEHPVPLDPDRGRPDDLGAPRRRRPEHPGGLRRLPAAVPRLARRRCRRRRDHRRHPGAGGDQAPLHRQPGVLQPPPQVQDRRHRPPEP